MAVKVAYVRVGTPQAPENIKLNEPLNNRLHCHAGCTLFGEGVVHIADPDLRPAIKANKTKVKDGNPMQKRILTMILLVIVLWHPATPNEWE